MEYKTVYAKNWFEYEMTAKLQSNGLYTISCYCTDPNGFYCAHKSWTSKDASYIEVELLFM